MADGDSGVSNLERSAFWIYGVTAMIMREPMSTLLRHGSTAGWGDPLIRVETLRVLVVLVFLSRLFLAAGLHFEIVFMRPESAKLFPKRSYPVDFLAGLGQLLVGVAASTVVSLHPAGPDGVLQPAADSRSTTSIARHSGPGTPSSAQTAGSFTGS